MGRTPVRRSSSNRYLRQGRATSGPQSLLGSAGLTERPSVEQLERRQMLFSLAITPDIVDPDTGLGTTRAFFGYAIPLLNTSVVIEDPQPPTTVVENFNEAAFGPVASGNPNLFASGLQVSHNIFPPGDIIINASPLDQTNQDRWLQINQDSNAEFFSLEFFTVPQQNQAGRPIVVRRATVTFEGLSGADLTGLLTDNVRVDLTRNDGTILVDSFTGADLRALFLNGNPNLGTGTAQFDAQAGFDSVKFTMIAPPSGGTPTFRIRNVTWDVSQSRFASLVETRLAWATVVLSGPVGASVTFLDLYGRDMVRTLAIGTPPNSDGDTLLIDLNDDGIPDFNDGIGSVRMINTDSRTALTIWGGDAVSFTGTPPQNADFIQNGWAFTIEDALIGSYDRFEDAGFAYAFDIPPGSDDIRFAGLPAGPGSVIIGSPFVRDNTNPGTYNPGGSAIQGFTVTDGFTRADQGIFVDDGGNLGSIYLHGILHGSSQFNGFVDRLYVGYLVGSITVDGDLGSLVVGTDAGQWAPEPDFSLSDPNAELDTINKTASQVLVGRTLGEFMVGGRSLVDLMVVGDLNNPATRPARDNFTYYEKEYVNGLPTNQTARDTVNTVLNNNAYVARDPRDQFRSIDQAMVFGPGFFRNDQIMGAEWLGGIATGTRIKGSLSGRDPLQGEDTADVYAFAVDGTQDVEIEAISGGAAPYIRVMDERGRTFAAPDLVDAGISTRITFKPRGPGVYYLVVTDPSDGRAVENGFANVQYSVAITGIASATLGAYRTAGGSGFTDVGTGEGNSVQVLAGNIGSLRIGTGLVTPAGVLGAPLAVYNTTQDVDDSLSWQGGAFSTPGTLYNITAGSDIGNPGGIGGGSPISVIVGGDFGNLVTGGAFGFAPTEGDLNFFGLQVGGRIASINVSGSIGVDHDRDGAEFEPLGGSFSSFVTGTAGGRGDIGAFEVNGNIFADGLSIRTSNGSTIGTFLVNNLDGAIEDRQGIFLGTTLQGAMEFRTGLGSNVRFADTPFVDLISSRDVVSPLIGGQTVEITDDGGSRVRISVDNAPEGFLVGEIVRIPIDGSQGVVISRIRGLDLSGGATLRIESLSSGVGTPISIGFIDVAQSSPGSAIQITGQVKVEVYRIQGEALDEIQNRTGGDMIAIDVAGLNRLQLSGDLGRTTVNSWGPELLGPYLGLAEGLVTEVGGALGVGDAEAFYPEWSGEIYHAVNGDVFNDAASALDDIGSPLDGYLNGLVVRDGSVQEIRIDGTIGDVILQGDGGTIVAMSANNDRTAPVGRFEGISGHVFATNILDLDIGDGLAESEPGPLLTSGIFALNDIVNIFSSRQSGAVISGAIIAWNDPTSAPDVIEGVVNGITSILLTNGLVKDAFIAAEEFDAFWISFNYPDGVASTGDMGNFVLTNTPVFRSTIEVRDLANFSLSGNNGYFDASRIRTTGNVDKINVTGFRNSTLTGTIEEIELSEILIAGDINTITATKDMTDLLVDVAGRVVTGINAVNISRSSIDVDGELKSLAVTRDFRGSNLNVGNLPSLTAGRNIQSSTIFVSGQLLTLTAGNAIANTEIQVTGPGGSIGTISAPNLISGSVAASGDITSIMVPTGDLILDITTINGGNVTTLSAGRDLVLSGDVSGAVGTLTAGRHFGAAASPGVFLVRNTLAGLNVANGQLYSDVRVGESITGAVVVGGAPNKLGNNLLGKGSIVAAGPITSVTINGDFDGDIVSFSGGLGTIAINNGSLLAGNTIAAYNASIASVTITNGNLYGNVHADVDITSLRVLSGADGVFGDIGINPANSNLISYDSRRNQLPLGVTVTAAAQGPTISAGRNIVLVDVPGGSVFESYFVAGQNINAITVAGTVQNDINTLGINSAFVAADSIDNVTINGGVNNTAFAAGVVSLGADGRLGGTGANADIVKPGTIKNVTINNGIVDGRFTAGMNAGFDGLYNTADDRSVQGLSTIAALNINGPVGNVSVYADILPASIANDNRFTRGGTNLANTNAQIDNGVGTPGTAFSGTRTFDNVNGASVTFAVSGPGQAFFNTFTNTLILRNTTGGTNLTVSSSTGIINNVKVVTNDDASLGAVTFNGRVTGDSDLVVDGNIATLTYGDYEGTGSISIGGDVGTATFASFQGGFFDAENVQSFRVNGAYGNLNTAVFNEVNVQLLSVGTITITGQAAGSISVDRDAASLTVNGTVDRSAFRFGRSLGSFTSPNFIRSFLSAGDNIGTITIGGDTTQSNIAAGADFGTNAAPGGTGLAADRVSSGNIGPVTILGNFGQSSISAGYLRGNDAFVGTSDDVIGGGRSSIGSVTISGTQTGSSRGSETFRIASNGTLGAVMIGGAAFTGFRGNFGLETPRLQPEALGVDDLVVTVTSNVSTANIVFNQPIDGSSISGALSVSEVRGSGDVTVRLVEGIDYTLSYDNLSNTVRVTFSSEVTARNLPQVPGNAGPGVYRFEIDQSRVRARLTGVVLDGNGDGLTNPNENFSGDSIVGDAGDRLTPGVVTVDGHRVDLYGPTSLDFVLDNNSASDGLPDPNDTFTVRGFIGDHPDNDSNVFRFGGDVDLYSVTLQAGQILRLGPLGGTAILAPITLLTPDGNPAGNTGAVVAIYTDRTDDNALTFGSDFLIKETGTYVIAVGNFIDVQDNTTITNPPAPPGGIGDYNFTVTIFDDGDSGFNGGTDAGDGSAVVDAPPSSSFAGQDGILGTADDAASLTVSGYVFTYSRGTDGLANTGDDFVTGTSSDGSIVSTRGSAGVTSVISSSIGPAGHAGIPEVTASDVDIFKLNNGNPITPGQIMTITVKLSDLGADLGSTPARAFTETRGQVQFAVFDISASTGIDDGTLLFSPTDFSPNGGEPNTVIADNGRTKYGYDANGDFYITFVTPDRIDLPGNSPRLAVYIQGVRNTDYQIVVSRGGTASAASRDSQNFLIETTGGLIDWLEAGNQTTSLGAFRASTLAFVGNIAGVPAQDYIINNVIASLNSLFRSNANGVGFDVTFSTNPADFEFQPFSTVFVTSSSDPISPIFNPFPLDPIPGFPTISSTSQPYGYSEHSDALNADLEDEAVVFAPSFALQGLSPSRADADQFVQALTAAVARRAGELMGLRVTESNQLNSTSFDPLAANAIDDRPGTGRAYTLPNFNRFLSDPFDSVNRTDFYLGQQNARSLLDKVLTRTF